MERPCQAPLQPRRFVFRSGRISLCSRWSRPSPDVRGGRISSGDHLKTGGTIPSFGNNGKVNLRECLGRDPKSIWEIQSGTPDRVFENPIILGSAPGEMYNSPPGDLRAYDVRVAPKPRSACS